LLPARDDVKMIDMLVIRRCGATDLGTVHIGGFRLIRAGKPFKYNVYVNVSSELRHADALAGLEVWMTMAWIGVSFIGMWGLAVISAKCHLGSWF